MRRSWSMLIARFALVLGVLVFVAGCGDQDGVLIAPGNPSAILGGQSLVLSAVSKSGVTWTLNGAGTLTNATGTTVLYTAPPTVTTSFTATVTATSTTNSSLSSTVTIPVTGTFAVTSTTLPAGQIGTAYSTTLTSGGGMGAVTWAVTTGSLPSGIQINAATGVISGTPTTVTSAAFTVTATDSASHTATQVLSIAISAVPVAPTVTTTTLPGGVTGTTYSQQLTYSPGTGSGTPVWAISSGSLTGSGLTLSSSGLISGTLTTAATYSFSVTVTLGSLTSAPQALSIVIAALVPPVVTTTTLPNGTTSASYSQQLTDTPGNGTGTPVWAISSGSLTGSGLTLSNSGLLSGTATSTAATYTFSVTVTVGSATSVAQPLTLVLAAPPPVVSTTTLPNGTVNTAYSQQLAYTGGGAGTAVWAISSGSLTGSGLTLSSSGLLSGTASASSATYAFSVTVTVGSVTSVAQALSLSILGVAPVITAPATINGEVNLPFNYPLTAIGGTPPYVWSVASGLLPTGVTLNSTTGVLSGSPTTVTGSPFTATLQAKDAALTPGTKAITFTIHPARSGTNSVLNGQYAFLLSGFDSAGKPLAVAGKFVADGAGNISSGVMDTNSTGLATPILNAALTATAYAVGSDNRARIVLTTSAGTMTFVAALNSITGGVAGGGYLTEFDTTGQSLTGVLALQDTTAFTTVSLTGGYALGLTGSMLTIGQHTGAIGELQLNGAGGLTSGELILSTVGAAPITPDSATYSVGSNGRGTAAVVLPGGAGTLNIVFEVVSSKQIFLLSSDPATGAGAKALLSGQALGQTVVSGNFSSTSLSGSAVFRSEGLLTTTTGPGTTYSADAQVGLYTFTGAGLNNGAVSLSSDENAGGVAKADTLTGTYTVAANGRMVGAVASAPPPGTIGGCTDCASVLFYGYLVGPNKGFTMDLSAGVDTGYFEPQAAVSFSVASLSGSYAAGTIQPIVQNAPYIVAALNANGTGTLTGAEDANSSGILLSDTGISGTYTINTAGRGAASIGAGSTPVVYMISPGRGLLIDTSAGNPVIQEIVH